MPRTLPMFSFLHPFLILLLLSSPPVCWTLLPGRLYFFGVIVEIGKYFSMGVGFESVLEVGDGVDGHFELLPLEDEALFLFVDDFDGLFHFIFEVEGESFQGELDICDFLEAKINKIFIIGAFDLFIVGVDLGVEERGQVALVVIALGRAHAYLHVGEDDEVVDAGVLVGLELPLEQLPLAVGAEFEEQLACQAYELLVRVVGGPLVLLLPLVDAPHLLRQTQPRLHAAHPTINFLYIHCHRVCSDVLTCIPQAKLGYRPPLIQSGKGALKSPYHLLCWWGEGKKQLLLKRQVITLIIKINSKINQREERAGRMGDCSSGWVKQMLPGSQVFINYRKKYMRGGQ